MKLSFVLPAYNEEQNIAKAVGQAVKFAQKRKLSYEVVVVNDGSSDNTGEIVRELTQKNSKIRLLTNKHNLGYGATVWKGLKSARGELVFMTDSDLQFDLNELDKFLEKISNNDLVIGYREKRSEGFTRWLNSFLWGVTIRVVLGLKVRDIDCAFKLFRKKVFNNLSVKSQGAMFSAELLYKIKKKGYRVEELPVKHFARKDGRPTGADLKVILKAIAELAKFKRETKRAI